MKKILFGLAFIFSVCAVNAQSTGPRFDSTGLHGDNTGRALSYDFKTLVDQTGADSVVITPRNWENIYNVQLKDSFTLKQPIVTGCYYGDVINLYVTAASGTPFLKFYGSNWITQGKLTMTTNLTAKITLYFDGAKWREVGRLAY